MAVVSHKEDMKLLLDICSKEETVCWACRKLDVASYSEQKFKGLVSYCIDVCASNAVLYTKSTLFFTFMKTPELNTDILRIKSIGYILDCCMLIILYLQNEI